MTRHHQYFYQQPPQKPLPSLHCRGIGRYPGKYQRNESLSRKRQYTYFWGSGYRKLRIAISRCYFWQLSRDCSSNLLLFSNILSCREKLEHDILNSNFWKIPFHPKIMSFALLKFKLPKMTDWYINYSFQKSCKICSARNFSDWKL